MGSSVKKKKDKKKDFQKPKLKVGKARPKGTNFTDTSFTSKSITLSQQSLHTTAPTLSYQFSHHLSLLSSSSDTQRRDSLAHLTTTIASRPTKNPLPLPVSVLLPKLLPLFLDGSHGVRGQLLKLLRTLPAKEVEDHSEKLLLYIRAGMTHLAADIRASSMDILSWALDVSGEALVSSPGGWFKTLKCFLTMLGWSQLSTTGGPWSSSSAATFSKAGNEGKTVAKNITVLGHFLRAGLSDSDDGMEAGPESIFPLWHVQAHMLPKRSNCFARLSLFGPLRDTEGEMYEDSEERGEVFKERFQGAIEKGLEGARREGGEVGRAAAAVVKVLADVTESHARMRYDWKSEDPKHPKESLT